MHRKIINMAISIIFLTTALVIPFRNTLAAGGIYASGGGSHVEGEVFSVTVKASGATFNAFQGTISVSGPATVVSVGAGSATWVKQPSNGGQFVGMVTSATNSLVVATVRLKGTKPGKGSVNISGVSLANNGSIVGTGAGGANFTITKAPVVPGPVTVTSTSHPSQEEFYDKTDIILNWEKATGVTGFSILLDQVADSALVNKADSAETTITYKDQKIGTYYFHIKAQNADGWGPVTHFKINIKEPDAKINKKLEKPSNITITKSVKFKNSVKDGTVTGIVIKGKIANKKSMDAQVQASLSNASPTNLESSTKELYQANLLLTPDQVPPEGKKLSVTPDKDGYFRKVIDWPIRAGAYKLVIQGQRDKVLTPVSKTYVFEIQQENGGKIYLLSASDEKEIIPTFFEMHREKILSSALTLIGVLLIYGIILLVNKILKRKKIPVEAKQKTEFKWD